MPWPLKSEKANQVHCLKESYNPTLPFFFEYFDFSDLIVNISRIIMKKYDLHENNYTSVHYRGGDFKGRTDVKAFVSLEATEKYIQSKILESKLPERIFMAAQSTNNYSGKNIILSDSVVRSSIAQLGIHSYHDTIPLIRLLVEFYIASKASAFFGNHYSTLSELIASYGAMNSKNFKYFFVEN